MIQREPGRRLLHGCVHGRFQPLHNGHLEYMLAAGNLCRHLIVGITNPDPTWIQHEDENQHRHRLDSNPFTFFERVQMVRGALAEAGINERNLSLVPFPIHRPDLLSNYIPPGTVHFIRVFSAWEQAKMQRLRDHGWQVEQLHPGLDKQISGSLVRCRLRKGLGWEQLMPPAVRQVVGHALQTDPLRFQNKAARRVDINAPARDTRK